MAKEQIRTFDEKDINKKESMQNSAYNMFFQELAGLNPQEVCRRALCKYEEEKKSYTLSVWGDEYEIFPHKSAIDPISGNFGGIHEYVFLFCLHYLLNVRDLGISNKWISEKDIPGGVTFFRGPHEIPTRLISKRFGNDTSEFKKKCARLHGIPLDMADAAFRFEITPRIPVAVLFWQGDDDFPPEAKLLYDKTITTHLTPDIVFALAVEICTRIGNPQDQPAGRADN